MTRCFECSAHAHARQLLHDAPRPHPRACLHAHSAVPLPCSGSEAGMRNLLMGLPCPDALMHPNSPTPTFGMKLVYFEGSRTTARTGSSVVSRRRLRHARPVAPPPPTTATPPLAAVAILLNSWKRLCSGAVLQAQIQLGRLAMTSW